VPFWGVASCHSLTWSITAIEILQQLTIPTAPKLIGAGSNQGMVSSTVRCSAVIRSYGNGFRPVFQCSLPS
jgi:hypothetical protein